MISMNFNDKFPFFSNESSLSLPLAHEQDSSYDGNTDTDAQNAVPDSLADGGNGGQELHVLDQVVVQLGVRLEPDHRVECRLHAVKDPGGKSSLFSLKFNDIIVQYGTYVMLAKLTPSSLVSSGRTRALIWSRILTSSGIPGSGIRLR